jgi:hypothetical protein
MDAVVIEAFMLFYSFPIWPFSCCPQWWKIELCNQIIDPLKFTDKFYLKIFRKQRKGMLKSGDAPWQRKVGGRQLAGKS